MIYYIYFIKILITIARHTEGQTRRHTYTQTLRNIYRLAVSPGIARVLRISLST